MGDLVKLDLPALLAVDSSERFEDVVVDLEPARRAVDPAVVERQPDQGDARPEAGDHVHLAQAGDEVLQDAGSEDGDDRVLDGEEAVLFGLPGDVLGVVVDVAERRGEAFVIVRAEHLVEPGVELPGEDDAVVPFGEAGEERLRGELVRQDELGRNLGQVVPDNVEQGGLPVHRGLTEDEEKEVEIDLSRREEIEAVAEGAQEANARKDHQRPGGVGCLGDGCHPLVQEAALDLEEVIGVAARGLGCGLLLGLLSRHAGIDLEDSSALLAGLASGPELFFAGEFGRDVELAHLSNSRILVTRSRRWFSPEGTAAR